MVRQVFLTNFYEPWTVKINFFSSGPQSYATDHFRPDFFNKMIYFFKLKKIYIFYRTIEGIWWTMNGLIQTGLWETLGYTAPDAFLDHG